jgi:hypothetical protein
VPKRFAIAWIVLLMAWMIEGFVVHGLLLTGDYFEVATAFPRAR